MNVRVNVLISHGAHSPQVAGSRMALGQPALSYYALSLLDIWWIC